MTRDEFYKVRPRVGDTVTPRESPEVKTYLLPREMQEGMNKPTTVKEVDWKNCKLILHLGRANDWRWRCSEVEFVERW